MLPAKSLLAFGIAATLLAVTARAEVIEQILVKVNGEIFTKSDLETRQISALRQRNRAVSQADLKNDEELRKALNEITPQIVLQAVDELLILQRAKEMNLHLTDERFAEILAKIRKDNKLEEEGQFEAALKQEGLSLAELRRSMERDMFVGEVQRQDVMQKIAITEEEAKAYYDAHKSEFTTTATVTLRELVVNVPEKGPDGQVGVNVGLDEEAKTKAEALRARALKGEDFTKMVADTSDAPSKANGGLIGPIKEDELSPNVQALIKTLKPGGVSEPVRIAKGWQIIKLESATQTVVQTFDQARDAVSNKVFMGKRGEEMEKYIKRMRAQAIIEWKNDEIKKLYEEAVANEGKEPAPAAAAENKN
jgi:parvulin-like peptidyl-prolyl isomerase